jgi:type I restriction enzyme S subunit
MVDRLARRSVVTNADPAARLSTTINLSEVVKDGLRFEASAYSIAARAAVEALGKSGLPLTALLGAEGLCSDAPDPIRTTRRWVEEPYGVPFLTSSDIICVRPQLDSFISRTKTKRLSELLIRPWEVMISRSGTVGNVGLASAVFAGKALSEDAIRLRAPNPAIAGYIVAFLRSRYGRPQLLQASYGSVVRHIEPQHLTRIVIPNQRDAVESIGQRVKKAYDLRDEANSLLDQAETALYELLDLPRLPDQEKKGPIASCVRASRLDIRFDASYHDPSVAKILRQISSMNTLRLEDKRLTSAVRAVTKFRKRVYVQRGGIPMLSSKQILQIDPVDVKRLAKGAHTKDLPEIALKERMIAVTCSGTIGRVQIIPAYMEGWTANQHAIRLIAAEDMNAGYLYAWLASEYGQRLIRRYSYGSVILEIDREMLGSVPVPYPGKSIRAAIGDLVLAANSLRDQAWQIERGAIDELEAAIESPSRSRGPSVPADPHTR